MQGIVRVLTRGQTKGLGFCPSPKAWELHVIVPEDWNGLVHRTEWKGRWLEHRGDMTRGAPIRVGRSRGF